MGKLEDNGCFRDRNEGQEDECEHADFHPCDDCPFLNMRKCRYCGEDFSERVNGEPSDGDVCPECGQPFAVTLPAWVWIQVMDKIAGTGNPDPEELGQAYKEIAKMVVS